MRCIFLAEPFASAKTQKKCIDKVSELATSLPKGYFYSIQLSGSTDIRRRVNLGGTYFELKFYVWNLEGKRVLWRLFEDSDGTHNWDGIYYSAKEEISKLPSI